MNTSLLSTKFNIPPSSEKLVARPRLFDRLNEGLRPDCLLTLVCAPAGYGKTSLVSDWLQQLKNEPGEEASRRTGQVQPDQIAWLTLDHGDDDLRRFLAYLIAALQRYQPDIGQGMIETFQSTRPPSAETLATWLINDLAAIPERFVLVLDDYHLISAQANHEFLAYLIDHQPPQMCLVIASRADPPLPLARLRARGQLIEVRQDELSFTLPEAEHFLNQMMGLTLTGKQLTTLEKRTEGWVAGLQLAALSMRNLPDIPSFIRTFSGGNMHIADFLADEVLAQQPARVKTFLLQTAILERLSARLCEAVSGQTDAQQTLEKLREENLFLIPLDQQQEWYRYHSLFADLLRKRLHQTQAELVDELHCRASQWYAKHDMPVPAIEHALAGCDYELAAGLIELVGEEALKRGETITLLRWLEALPAESRQAHPILLVLYGLVLVMCGNSPDAAKAELDQAIAAGDVAGVQGELATFQALLAMMRGILSEAIQLSESALQQLAPGKVFFRSLAADNLGMAYTLKGDTAAASRAFEQAADLAEQSDNVVMTVGALSNLAGLLILQGKLRAAAASYTRILNLAAERAGNRAQLTGKALLGLGMLAREWNDLDGASRHYEDAVEMFQHSVEIGLPVVYLSIAMVRLNQRDLAGAQTYLDKARQYSQATTTTKLDDQLVEETQARFWVMQGKYGQVEEWLQTRGYADLGRGEILALIEQGATGKLLANQTLYLTIVRLYLARKQPEHVLAVLEPLLAFYHEKGHMRKVIELLALKALALTQQKELDPAMQSLDQALSLAEPEGYVRTFLDEGEPMAQLLYLGIERGIYPTYTGKLLAAFTREMPDLSIMEGELDMADALIEALSERELEVLVLIADGLSNQEIAAKLYITLSTVKTHASQIYSKLNVRTRTQAVARARGLGLIPII